MARRGQGLGRALCRLVPPPAHLTPESGSLTYVLVVIHTLMLQPPELIGSLLIGSLPEHTEPAVRPHPRRGHLDEHRARPAAGDGLDAAAEVAMGDKVI